MTFALLVGGPPFVRRSTGRRWRRIRRKEAIRSLHWKRLEELVVAHCRSQGYSLRRKGGSGPVAESPQSRGARRNRAMCGTAAANFGQSGTGVELRTDQAVQGARVSGPELLPEW